MRELFSVWSPRVLPLKPLLRYHVQREHIGFFGYYMSKLELPLPAQNPFT